MSPLVEQKRVAPRPPRRPNPATQHWAMLLFESAGAGVLAIFIGFMAVSTVVGIYVILVWPLTFWDLSNLHLERFSPWIEPVVWSVFAGGTLAGFLCFSGLIFGGAKPRAAPSIPASTARMRPPAQHKGFPVAGVTGRVKELSRQ